MSPSKYQELVEFLTGQFAQVERRFHDLTLELNRRLTVVDERLASLRAEVDERFREVSGHFEEIYRPSGATGAGVLRHLSVAPADRGGRDRRRRAS